MNKDQLQQELKEKIKEGIKPSDLKKKKTGENIGSIPTPPPPPPILNKEENTEDIHNPDFNLYIGKVAELQKNVKYWSDTAANYLKRLGQLEAELDNQQDNSDEGYESDDENVLYGKPNKQQTHTIQELELALQEANTKIRDQEQSLNNLNNKINSNKEIINDLTSKNQKQDKTIEELKNQAKSKENDKERSLKETKDQGTKTEIRWQESQEPQKLYLFTCDICEQNKKSKLHLGRVNGLGINPHKQNKICDYCINKVDLITEKDNYWYGNY